MVQWCSDEQYLRLHSPCSPQALRILPSMYLKLVVIVNAWHKPGVPSVCCPLSTSTSFERTRQHQADAQTCEEPLQAAQGMNMPGVTSSTATEADTLPDYSAAADPSAGVAPLQLDVASECPSLKQLLDELWQRDSNPPSSDVSPARRRLRTAGHATVSSGSPEHVPQQRAAADGTATAHQHPAQPMQSGTDTQCTLQMPPTYPLTQAGACIVPKQQLGWPSLDTSCHPWTLIGPHNMGEWGFVDLLGIGCNPPVFSLQL